MKRGVCIAVIVTFLLAICALEQILVSGTLNTLKNKTTGLKTFLQDYENIDISEIYIK